MSAVNIKHLMMREVAAMPSLQYSLMMTRLNLFPKIEFPIYIDYIITFSLVITTKM